MSILSWLEVGRLAPEEAREHEHANILLRSVGTEAEVEPELFEVVLRPGDTVLLCSRGLWSEVTDAEIQEVLLAHNEPRMAARELIRASHHGGGVENASVIVVRIP